MTNHFATNVIGGNAETAYFINNDNNKEQRVVYKLQFVTKSVLFNEIESALTIKFPNKEFYIYATPIVQTTTRVFERLHDSVKTLEPHIKKEIK